jgi:hypothetical protein
MGFLDKLKGAVNAVTGGGANVTIEYAQAVVFPGDAIPVRITATSTGAEVKSGGIFVDLSTTEEIKLNRGDFGVESHMHLKGETWTQQVQIAPAFVLPAGQTMQFEGRVQIPANAPASTQGKHVALTWLIRGRVEAFGNDPDSGFKPLYVGKR